MGILLNCVHCHCKPRTWVDPFVVDSKAVFEELAVAEAFVVAVVAVVERRDCWSLKN